MCTERKEHLVDETRKRTHDARAAMQDVGARVAENVRDAAEKVKDDVLHSARNVRRHGQEIKQQARDIVEDVKAGARDVVEDVEDERVVPPSHQTARDFGKVSLENDFVCVFERLECVQMSAYMYVRIRYMCIYVPYRLID